LNEATSSIELSADSMDWDNVRVFLGVTRGGQFVAAAKRLKLTPQLSTAPRAILARCNQYL
jgi:hypothetical protein